jgi:hypothetical protein
LQHGVRSKTIKLHPLAGDLLNLLDAAKFTSPDIYSSRRKEIVRIHGWFHSFLPHALALARRKLGSVLKFPSVWVDFTTTTPGKWLKVPILPLFSIAIAVDRVAEKQFELFFSAGNSDTVYIRASKVPRIIISVGTIRNSLKCVVNEKELRSAVLGGKVSGFLVSWIMASLISYWNSN